MLNMLARLADRSESSEEAQDDASLDGGALGEGFDGANIERRDINEAESSRRSSAGARERLVFRCEEGESEEGCTACLLYTSPSPRDRQKSRMPSSA